MTLGVHLCRDGRIVVPGGLRLTLQRGFREDWQAENGVPRSYGRLPFVSVPNEAGFAIPILSGETVWIGLEAPPHEAIAQLKVSFSESARGFHLQCPPDFAIASVDTGKGFRQFEAGDTLRISVLSAKDNDPYCILLRAFEAEQVLPPSWQETHGALDRSDGYSGERLP